VGSTTRGRPRDLALDHRILGATRAAIATDGYAGLSIEAVARAAGAGKQSVYRRWARKPLLVFDALFGGADAVAEVLPDTGSLVGDLEAISAEQTRVYATPEMLVLVRGLVADCLSEPASLEWLRRRFIAPRLEVLATVAERARARGEVAGDVDSSVIAEAMAGTMFAHFVLYSEDVGSSGRSSPPWWPRGRGERRARRRGAALQL
jgi:AcrR family transcriptional regulator